MSLVPAKAVVPSQHACRPSLRLRGTISTARARANSSLPTFASFQLRCLGGGVSASAAPLAPVATSQAVRQQQLVPRSEQGS